MKTKVALTALVAMLTLAAAPIHSLADGQTPVVQSVSDHGRLLIPVRYVSEVLGGTVVWNRQSKTITVNKGDSEVLLAVDSNKAKLDGSDMTLDVPAQIRKGVTYVPIRFISQAFGGTIAWDAETHSANVVLGDVHLSVLTDASYNESKIPQETVNLLIAKVNEAADLSSIKQVRAHFKPYFTDAFISKLISHKGLKITDPFFEIAHSYSDDKTGKIDQFSATAGNPAYEFDRTIAVEYSGGRWLVDDVTFTEWMP